VPRETGAPRYADRLRERRERTLSALDDEKREVMAL
jgi:hypothetical protein